MIPVVLLILAVSVKRLWVKIPLILGILPLLIISLILGLFTGLWCLDVIIRGIDYSFEPIRSLEIQHSRVVIYPTDGGATTSFGLVGRQEKRLLPGVLLVRNICNVYPGYDVAINCPCPQYNEDHFSTLRHEQKTTTR